MKKNGKKKSRRVERKKQKDLGLAYINTSGDVVPRKYMKENPCTNSKICNNQCNTFTEETRQSIFDFYWNLGCSDKQKRFLSDCASVCRVKRRRKSKKVKARSITVQYFLIKGNAREPVCKQFLLATLSVTVRLLRTVLSNKKYEKFPEPDSRGRHVPHNKVTEDLISNFKEFISSLPAVPSHYCRSSSSKAYLPTDVKSLNNLYRMYVSQQKSNTYLKKGKFLQLFKELYNIGIHIPRKDKCGKCEKYKNLPEEMRTELEKEIYNEHIKEKDRIKEQFLKDQKLSSEEYAHLVISFDLQKVLATPHGDNMLLGFSRKYAVYNLSVYESNSKKGFCYLWEEKDAKRGSNEICSNMYHYLQQVDKTAKYKKISMYCDNCSGQNKNRYMFAMIRHFLNISTHVEEIAITFLIAGHTYMPVDSIHAVIEKFIKNKVVQAPSEWPTILRNARINPEPYIVVKQKFFNFLDFKCLQLEKNNKIKISEIKKARFLKDDFNLKIKYSFKDDVENNFYFQLKPGAPKPAYSSEQPITTKKYDLKKLCEDLVIKPEYHLEYLTLKHSGSVPDVLSQSDIEDED